MYEKKILKSARFMTPSFLFFFHFFFSYPLTNLMSFLFVYFFVALSTPMPLAQTLTSGCCKAK